jgi:hypothetical protein
VYSLKEDDAVQMPWEWPDCNAVLDCGKAACPTLVLHHQDKGTRISCMR